MSAPVHAIRTSATSGGCTGSVVWKTSAIANSTCHNRSMSNEQHDNSTSDAPDASVHREDRYTERSTDEMIRLQDAPESLRLLLAQRRMHDRSKRWSMARYVGLTVLALFAPVIAVLVPVSAVYIGAISGVWLFFSRALFRKYEQEWSAKAAAAQEAFDHLIFGIDSSVQRTPTASLEEIAVITGTDGQVQQAAVKNKLLGWYPFDSELDGVNSVAIAQRANAIYSERLLKLNARIWLIVVGIWATAVLVYGIAANSASVLVLGIIMPLLPALLDVIEQYQFVRRAAGDRRKLADAIESQLRESGPITAQSLLVWQDQMYNLRRESPQVPNLVYKAVRNRNEQAMNQAASQLANAVKGQQSSNGGPPSA